MSPLSNPLGVHDYSRMLKFKFLWYNPVDATIDECLLPRYSCEQGMSVNRGRRMSMINRRIQRQCNSRTHRWVTNKRYISTKRGNMSQTRGILCLIVWYNELSLGTGGGIWLDLKHAISVGSSETNPDKSGAGLPVLAERLADMTWWIAVPNIDASRDFRC